MSLRFIGYARVSTDKQTDNSSFENQKREIEEYIKARNGILLEIYKETFSGKESNRPILMKAIQDCKNSNARLIVSKLDRLSRSVPFILNFTEKFEVEFVVVEFPEQYSKHMLYIFSIFAEMERDMISERTKEALRAKMASGEYKPTGDNLINAKPNVRPSIEARERQREKFRRTIYLELERICEDFYNKNQRYPYLEEIINLLNERQNKTFKGHAWTKSAINNFFSTAKRLDELKDYKINVLTKIQFDRFDKGISKTEILRREKQERQNRIQRFLEDEKQREIEKEKERERRKKNISKEEQERIEKEKNEQEQERKKQEEREKEIEREKYKVPYIMPYVPAPKPPSLKSTKEEEEKQKKLELLFIKEREKKADK